MQVYHKNEAKLKVMVDYKKKKKASKHSYSFIPEKNEAAAHAFPKKKYRKEKGSIKGTL